MNPKHKALEAKKGMKRLPVKDGSSEKDQARLASSKTVKNGVARFGGKTNF